MTKALSLFILATLLSCSRSAQEDSATPPIVEDRHGVYRLVVGPTSCHSRDGVNPMVWMPSEDPRAGEPVRAMFTTKALRPFPDDPVWIFASFGALESPIDFGQFGMPGCWSLVNLDVVMLSLPGESEGILTRPAGSGEVMFQWNAPPDAEGAVLCMQGLVANPGEPLATPAVHIILGSAR